MVCKQCGKEIENNQKFCASCGTPIQLEKDNKKKNRKWIVILSVVVVVAMVVLGIILVLNNKSGNEEEATQVETASTEVAEDSKTSKEAAESTEAEETPITAEYKKLNTSEYTGEICKEIIAALKVQENVIPANKDTLMEMANVLSYSKVCLEEGSVLSKMSPLDRESLDMRIINATWSGGVFHEELYLWDSCCYKDEANQLFYDVYGSRDIPIYESGIFEDEGDSVMFMVGDGEEVHLIDNADVKEGTNYYLLSAPYFLGSNGYNCETLLGYMDILFLKNEDSRFGVTMIYAQTYQEEKNITSVETAGDLATAKNYPVENLFDGNYQSVWMEHKDSGSNKQLIVHLAEPTTVHDVLLYNGHLSVVEDYYDNGKVSQATCDFGNGAVVSAEIPAYDLWTEEGAIPEYDYMIGRIELETSVVTDTIILTIDATSEGYENDRASISELKIY